MILFYDPRYLLGGLSEPFHRTLARLTVFWHDHGRVTSPLPSFFLQGVSTTLTLLFSPILSNHTAEQSLMTPHFDFACFIVGLQSHQPSWLAQCTFLSGQVTPRWLTSNWVWKTSDHSISLSWIAAQT